MIPPEKAKDLQFLSYSRHHLCCKEWKKKESLKKKEKIKSKEENNDKTVFGIMRTNGIRGQRSTLTSRSILDRHYIDTSVDTRSTVDLVPSI